MLESIETVPQLNNQITKIITNGYCPIHSITKLNDFDHNRIQTRTTTENFTISKMIRYTCSFLLIIALSIIIVLFIVQLSASSLLEARLNYIHRLLKETPLITGHCSTRNSNFYQALKSLESNEVSAIFWPISVPCGAQFLDAVQLCLEYFDQIKRQVLRTNDLIIINTIDDLYKAHAVGNISVMLGIEGGHNFGDSLAVLRSFYELGARFVTVAYTCDTVWAKSSTNPTKSLSVSNGLSDFGRNMILEMNRLGLIIDLSQASEMTALNVLTITHAPVVFSHSIAAQICNNSKNAISDQLLQKIALNGGIIMVDIGAYNECGRSDNDIFAFLFDNFKHIRSIAGVNHIGFGSIDTHEQYPYILAELARQPEWSTADIKKIIGGNLLRVFQEVDIVKNNLQKSQSFSKPLEAIIPINDLEDNTYCRFPDIT